MNKKTGHLLFVQLLLLVTTLTLMATPPATAEEYKMDMQNIVLDIKLRDSVNGTFLHGQAAAFDIILKNETTAPVEVYSLEMNSATPVIRVLHADGTPMGEYNPITRKKRMVGNQKSRGSLSKIELKAGETQETWVNLWSYVAPFPKGHYLLEVHHQIDDEGHSIHSKQIPFELVDTQPTVFALGYDSVGKTTSILAWAATPAESTEPPQLLIRYSNIYNHLLAHQGGTPHGQIAPDSKLSVGQIPEGLAEWPGWVAVTTADHVELILHNMSFPELRSKKISLPIKAILPVPRFPDRGHAIYLGTGIGKNGEAQLAGVKVNRDGSNSEPWSLPLAHLPSHSASAFSADGDISLLLIGEDGDVSHISRVDVDEGGNVTTNEHVVRTTSNRVLAVTADMRPGKPMAFFVLEADRQRHNQLTLTRVPLKGEAELFELPAVSGWPILATSPGAPDIYSVTGVPLPPSQAGEYKQSLLQADSVTLETAADGKVWVAFVDEQKHLFSGRISNGELTLHRYGNEDMQAYLPHLVALGNTLYISAFSETGALFITGEP